VVLLPLEHLASLSGCSALLKTVVKLVVSAMVLYSRRCQHVKQSFCTLSKSGVAVGANQKLLAQMPTQQTRSSIVAGPTIAQQGVLHAAHLEEREHVTHDVAELEPSQVVDLDLQFSMNAA
jgi:hypothetical protein